MKEILNSELEKSIDNAVAALKSGKLVAFPTETVYGLGADASNAAAVRRIFEVKKRPLNHPLIVHLADISEFGHWGIEINSTAWRLAEHFWPGPLTLIVKRASHVLDEVTGGQETVGLRVPSHPVAQALLNTFKGAIAAPSANHFGYISPTSASHVQKELGHSVAITLDGGDCNFGIESTIVDVTSTTPRILRLGAIAPNIINLVTECVIENHSSSSVRASGTLVDHYAPSIPLHLLSASEIENRIRSHFPEGEHVAVLAINKKPRHIPENIHWVLMPKNSKDYEHTLYATLRKIDSEGFSTILVERPPNEVEWLAVSDRLEKARFKTQIKHEIV